MRKIKSPKSWNKKIMSIRMEIDPSEMHAQTCREERVYKRHQFHKEVEIQATKLIQS